MNLTAGRRPATMPARAAKRKYRLPHCDGKPISDLVALFRADLLGSDSLRRTNAGASTAFDTFVGIDYIYIAGRDSLYGALVDAGAASDAQIGIDFVSHFCKFK